VVGRALPRLAAPALDAVAERFTAPLGRREGESLYGLQQQLREVMWEHVGLIRHAAGLKAALRDIEEIGQRAPAVLVPGGTSYNLAWQDWMNLQNQVAAAWLIARSALEREESRGSHFRHDHPVSIDLLYNVLVVSDERVGLRVWTEPVRLTRLSPAGLSQPTGVEIGD
jgi:succinate dehydrogenase/fumarate reductase flavoprotein subunit